MSCCIVGKKIGVVVFSLLDLYPFVIFEIKICMFPNDFYTLCPILIILIWHLYHQAKQV